jgi:hypothetical protein
MPRKAGGKNNPSHKKARKRIREQLSREVRTVQFHTMAARNNLVFEPSGPYAGFRAYYDPYEWTIARGENKQFSFPQMLLMGSAMSWLYEAILGYEAGEEKRKTKRHDAEDRHEDLLQDAAQKGLHQWIPQPVPDDFECPYTGVAADKRKILATGVRYKRIEGATPAEKESYVYDGHATFVVYKAEHRGGWYAVREIWKGHRDSEGNRVGVKIEELSFGQAKGTRPLGVPAPGLPYRGVKGYSGQPGKPILPDHSDRKPRPGLLDPSVVFETARGYEKEVDARKAVMLHMLSAVVRDKNGKLVPAAVMGNQNTNARRASRMRGGARQATALTAHPPFSVKPGVRPTATIPPHVWNGNVVHATGEDKAPLAIKKRRVRKAIGDAEEVRDTMQEWRDNALRNADTAGLKLVFVQQLFGFLTESTDSV